jgi:hypothetical protein
MNPEIQHESTDTAKILLQIGGKRFGHIAGMVLVALNGYAMPFIPSSEPQPNPPNNSGPEYSIHGDPDLTYPENTDPQYPIHGDPDLYYESLDTDKPVSVLRPQ